MCPGLEIFMQRRRLQALPLAFSLVFALSNLCIEQMKEEHFKLGTKSQCFRVNIVHNIVKSNELRAETLKDYTLIVNKEKTVLFGNVVFMFYMDSLQT